MDKKSLLFIVNPFAGHASKARIPHLIQKKIDKTKFDVELVFTEYGGHATNIAAEARKNGTDAVIAVGGDGTINEVASGLVYGDTAMGIIPGGSGNGLSTHLGIGRSANRAIQIINQFNIETIDTATVNDHLYVNMAGIGIDGLVAYRTKMSAKRGFKTYLKGALSEAAKYKNQKYKVEIDGRVLEDKFLSVNVANGSMFGYNFTIASKADTSDGLMDALMIHDAWKAEYFSNAWRFWAGNIHRSRIATADQSECIKVTTYEDTYIHIDGEGFEQPAGEIEFKVQKQSLRVIC